MIVMIVMIPMMRIISPTKKISRNTLNKFGNWSKQCYLLFLLLLLSVCFQGCTSLFREKAKPPVKLTRRLPIARLINKPQLELAIEKQLDIFSRKTLSPKLRQFNGQVISQELLLKSLLRFQELINTCSSDKELRRILQEEFDIYKSTGGPKGKVLYTGYYTPFCKASRVREGEFQYPLYRLPDNYQTLDLSPLRKNWKNTTITVYVDDKGAVRLPPSRREIEENQVYAGKNLELAWVNDPFDAFMAQVQGSLIVEYQDDGQRQFLNYAGKNGYEYSSVGRELYRDERMKLDEINMASMKNWFEKHPASLDEYLNRNDSYVYFIPEEDGPFGAEGAIVTEWASIATDKRIFPAGGVALIDTQIPMLDDKNSLIGWTKHTCFAIDQDTGGAITGPGRVDIYMGAGEKAGAMAGYQKEEGNLYYLLLRSDN